MLGDQVAWIGVDGVAESPSPISRGESDGDAAAGPGVHQGASPVVAPPQQVGGQTWTWMGNHNCSTPPPLAWALVGTPGGTTCAAWERLKSGRFRWHGRS
jgi:hypothetical protein